MYVNINNFITPTHESEQFKAISAAGVAYLSEGSELSWSMVPFEDKITVTRGTIVQEFSDLESAQTWVETFAGNNFIDRNSLNELCADMEYYWEYRNDTGIDDLICNPQDIDGELCLAGSYCETCGSNFETVSWTLQDGQVVLEHSSGCYNHVSYTPQDAAEAINIVAQAVASVSSWVTAEEMGSYTAEDLEWFNYRLRWVYDNRIN